MEPSEILLAKPSVDQTLGLESGGDHRGYSLAGRVCCSRQYARVGWQPQVADLELMFCVPSIL
jgi:hypothetical protein